MRYKWHKRKQWTNYYFTSHVSLNLLEITEKPQQNGGKKRVSKEEKNDQIFWALCVEIQAHYNREPLILRRVRLRVQDFLNY